MFPHAITVFNKWFNKEKREDEYHKTILNGVYWDDVKQSNAIKGGYEGADSVQVVIPMSVAENIYKSPKEYQKLPKEDARNYFTLQEGDKIVKGNINVDYASMAQLEKDFDNVRTITKVDVKDMSLNSYLNHIEIGGK